MDREQLEQLNAQASERYLGGEYAEALFLWRKVLEHDPEHEQALEGVRLAESMVPAGAEPVPASSPGPAVVAEPGLDLLDEDLLEDGLGALDELPDRPTPEPPPVVPDPDRQAGGIDFGDPDHVESLSLEGGDAENAAAAELTRRLQDLLGEAETALSEGRPEDARATISRIFILDEDNARARELEAQLVPAEPVTDSGADIETWLTEGVQWLEQDRVEEARERFLKVLEVAPEHMEALAYLEKADALLAAPAAPEPQAGSVADEDDLSQLHTNLPEDPDTEAVPLVAGEGEGQGQEWDDPLDEEPLPAAVPDAPAAKTRSGGGGRKWIGLGAAAVIVLGALWYVPRMLLDRPPELPPLVTPTERPATAGLDTIPAEVPEQETSLADRGARIEEAVARAEQAMTDADYSAAVIAYNDILSIDPDHEGAGRGLRQAGDLYRQQRESEEQLRKARIAFEDGDYAAALRIFYRMPDGDAPRTIARYKLNGWFNLGVVALKAGDPEKAAQHLAEAYEIDTGDRETDQLLRLAQAYSRRSKDRTYYRAVDGLGFRNLED